MTVRDGLTQKAHGIDKSCKHQKAMKLRELQASHSEKEDSCPVRVETTTSRPILGREYTVELADRAQINATALLTRQPAHVVFSI